MSPDPVATLDFNLPAQQQGSITQTAQPQQLTSLWDWYSMQQNWSLSQPPLPALGSFVLPARLQSHSALQAGDCSLSGSLFQGVANLADSDTFLLAYKTQQHPHQIQNDNRHADSKTAVYLRLMLDLNTGKHHCCWLLQS